jgi:hypothetical protein
LNLIRIMPAKGEVMSIVMPSRGVSRETFSPFDRSLFGSIEPAGRKITAGFTYLQRISKAASYDVWFPDELKQVLAARVLAGGVIGSDQFPAQWAAVRQFELLQEAGNYKIYDLDPSNLQRAMLDLSKSMRAGGYRITVATIGSYCETSTGDELEILDMRLQKRIAQMIHMLYLDEQSGQTNSESDARLAAGQWDFRDQLPHVGMVLGAQSLFKRENIEEETEEDPIVRKRTKRKSGGSVRQLRHAQRFFDIISHLPQQHIVHDTAIGLQLPELNGENEWNYIASSDETLGAFNRVLGDLFDKFNHVSLSRLNGHADAHAEIKSSTYHMRGHGHPLTESALRFYRGAALALN